jgi:hypothetical protein
VRDQGHGVAACAPAMASRVRPDAHEAGACERGRHARAGFANLPRERWIRGPQIAEHGGDRIDERDEGEERAWECCMSEKPFRIGLTPHRRTGCDNPSGAQPLPRKGWRSP